jgi:hypothetical protein
VESLNGEISGAVGAPQAAARQPLAGWLARRTWPRAGGQRPLAWATTVEVRLDRDLADHGLRNARAAIAAAIGFGALYGARVWQSSLDRPDRVRLLVVDALVAFVLTPLVVSVYLALPDLATRLLLQLRQDAVIDPAAAGRPLDQFAHDLQQRLREVFKPAAFLAALYFAYALWDASRLPRGSWLEALLVVASLPALTVIFYLTVVVVFWLWRTSQAVGRLLRSHHDHKVPYDFPIRVQPLHPDGFGGLWIVGRFLSLVLYTAAVMASVGVGLFLALPPNLMVFNRRAEPYLLGLFYAFLLPSALTNLLWQPHRLLDQYRDEILGPIARAFDATIGTARPRPGDDAQQLKARTDLLSEVNRQFGLLDAVCPRWPLHTRRLQRVIATAILPVAVSVTAAVLTNFLAR